MSSKPTRLAKSAYKKANFILGETDLTENSVMQRDRADFSAHGWDEGVCSTQSLDAGFFMEVYRQ